MWSASVANRLGFLILGMTNNFGYVVMLAAAFDLLKEASNGYSTTTSLHNQEDKNSTKYCNQHSTSTVLLADIVPALVMKLSYPFLLVKLGTNLKVAAVAGLSAISFIVTGYARHEALIFSGVVCASLASGLGESVYLTNIPHYGDSSLSGWSMGTGAAGLLGATTYAVLRMLLSIRLIMLLMLVVPIAMLLSYCLVIKPINIRPSSPGPGVQRDDDEDEDNHDERGLIRARASGNYGGGDNQSASSLSTSSSREQPDSASCEHLNTVRDKIRHLPGLAKYFVPLLLVYFAEYFINQGLFELIYYPEMRALDHATQYSWFQVAYQLGVLVSRSSLDLFRIRHLGAMALLQALNLALFLAHAAKLIHVPSFYLILALIVYEGLLGGFTYTNTYDRLRREIPAARREFSIGVVTVADTLGIVAAGLVALPVHDALCHLYDHTYAQVR